MSKTYQKYPYLETSDKLNLYDKEEYQNGLSQTNGLIDMSLFHLTHLLSKHHEKEVMVLIDDLDIPLLSGINHNYSNAINGLIINMLANANHKPSYTKAFIITATIIPDELMSKLSHAGFRFDSVVQPSKLKAFGFTKEEVTKLLSTHHLPKKLEEVQTYYDGYNLDLIKNIFNPRSVIQYLNTKKLQPYLPKIDMKYPKLSTEDLNNLIKGEELTIDINYDIWQYHNLNSTKNPYIILIFLGYLTYCGALVTDRWGETKIDYEHYSIKIPNKEIMTIIKNSY